MKLQSKIFHRPCIWLFMMVLSLLYGGKGNLCFAEGSGDWGTATNRRSWLWVPEHRTSSTGNGHYITRGYMMMPSSATDYNPEHRLFVYVKSGETVYWGFRKVRSFYFSSSSWYTYYNNDDDIRVRWYYDGSDEGFFPNGTSGGERSLIDDHQYNAHANGGLQGRPANATAAANGPNEIIGSGGYDAYSFTNNTGADRAFWVEISSSNGNPLTDGLPISFWDITVANSADEVQPGRVYSKYWSIISDLPESAGVANDKALHDDFGFYVPVDDTFEGGGSEYFVKHARFSSSNSGFVNFFANQDGPRNDQDSHVDNRKSIQGTSSNYQYPLFINDPDHEFWPTTEVPTASMNITYEERVPSGSGGHAWVDIDISLPGIVDVLIDLDGNGVYDDGVDIVLSESYDAPGEYQVYWDGKDANGNVIVSGSTIEVFAAVIFSPVHFPVYDMEQSLGITITNVRPGSIEDNAIYWDDSLIPRDEESGFVDLDDDGDVSAISNVLNVTGEAGTSHIWYADGDNGFSQNNTINTWAASYYAEVNEEDGYRYLTFQGNVLDDEDGLEDNLVSGSPTLASGLYALIVDESNLVVASAPVLVDGTYTIDRVPDGVYKVILSTEDAMEGETSPVPSLPENWENSGEQLGTGVGENLKGQDGVIEAFDLNNTSVVNANFGLRVTAVLPVIWGEWKVDFLKDERSSSIKWTVSKEWESSHYEIERSVDGIEEFEKVGEVDAVGWADESIHYEFMDEHLPISGSLLYYRVKQVDLDGKFSYSELRSLKIPGISARSRFWEVYPNPITGNELSVVAKGIDFGTNEHLRFRLLGVSSVSSYVDVLGEEMLSIALKGLLADMGNGFYLLEIQWDNKKEILKLIKR
ncbi:hypothetical protein KZP23_04250 [Echinicola marina]|uniref:hypothetical protein n=1 Tax=Echinicola marina TaxID=2859768 RepID=UPI001CF61AA8|nr:hypothetical protein [Echinicola marina]UCS94251.1 hypothetical protein KZP23_04250 [Echinicola marina]